MGEYYQERVNAPVLAGLASLVVPGAGQMYNRYFLRAAVFFFGFLLAYLSIGTFSFVITAGSIAEAVMVSLQDARSRRGEFQEG